MTLIVAGVTTTLLLLAGGVFAALVDAAVDRGRAQTAADAAALAAVAESAPGAEGAHIDQARRFAEANGASLIGCVCGLGKTSARVTVVLEGVEASARAEIDPSAFMPDLFTGTTKGLEPRMQRAVDQLLRASGGRVFLVSGRRSSARQQVLWRSALERYGDPEVADDWVARPGDSLHERGLAVDLGGDLQLAASLVTRLGLPLHRPLAKEPWHFELVSAR